MNLNFLNFPRASVTVFGVCFALGLAACSSDAASDSASRPEYAASAGAPSAARSSSSSSVDGGIQAGTLTAGVWDDNKNFTFFRDYASKGLSRYAASAPPFSMADLDAAHDRFAGAAAAKRVLDVALVIDTTGSMGDEIAYLQREFDALTRSIAEKYPAAEQRWSLVLYRDEGDHYVVKSSDFRADLTEYRADLAAQGAGGGGDFPEAPDRALAATSQLSWRTDADVARVAFWIADAPHHDQRRDAMASAVKGLAESGVHVYPVASSGVDSLTELTMRTTAQLTGGRYVFLTDDSGVGNAHQEPTVPCYFVTRLDNAIIRMIDIELGGTYREPAASDVIRTSGDPTGGVCKLADQVAVSAF